MIYTSERCLAVAKRKLPGITWRIEIDHCGFKIVGYDRKRNPNLEVWFYHDAENNIWYWAPDANYDSHPAKSLITCLNSIRRDLEKQAAMYNQMVKK